MLSFRVRSQRGDDVLAFRLPPILPSKSATIILCNSQRKSDIDERVETTRLEMVIKAKRNSESIQ